MKIKSYKELIGYQKAYELVKYIYKITDKFPRQETYGIVSQLRRATVSIPSNIAEGYMRGSKEYVQFLKVSFGSSAELETLISLAKDLKLCNENDFNTAYSLLQEVMRLIRTYINRMAEQKQLVGLDASR